MSGVAGAPRIKSRQDFDQFIASYHELISKFPGFVNMQASGSYNSDPNKTSFGDIDLIVFINSDQDKKTVKSRLAAWLESQPEDVIMPFGPDPWTVLGVPRNASSKDIKAAYNRLAKKNHPDLGGDQKKFIAIKRAYEQLTNPKQNTEKNPNRRSYNSGEIVSVRYYDPKLGYSAQIDNIVALGSTEANFKMQFLDMPASVQGLVLGLTKVATLVTPPQKLFQRLDIKITDRLKPSQAWEFNLSSVELQLRKITYDPEAQKQGQYKEQVPNREIVWRSKNYNDVKKLLQEWDLNQGFQGLLSQIQSKLKTPRSKNREHERELLRIKNRIRGVFQSMVHVTSGEVGTEKGLKKQKDIEIVQRALTEQATKPLKQVVIQAGGYHPFHAGHMALWQAAHKRFPGADFYIVTTADTKQRPFPFEIKKSIAELAGVNPDQFVQVKSPYNPVEIKDQYDPETTQLIFVRSEKDRDKPPLPGTTKKDGSPSKLQLWGSSNEPMSKYEYMAYLPTIKFAAGSDAVTSASEIRTKWKSADNKEKTQLLQTVYPNANAQAREEIKLRLDQVLSKDAPVVKENDLQQDLDETDFTHDIEFHKQLNPALWQDHKMIPEVSDHLLQIAHAFEKFLDLDDLDIDDITVSGSNAAYTYTDHSDIDLHLVIDVPKSEQEFMRKYFDAKKTIFNERHDISINDQPVEVYVQFHDQPHTSAGLYSLLRGEWIDSPKPVEADVNDTEVQDKLRQYVQAIHRAVRRKNLDAIEKILTRLKEYRKQGLSTTGELGTANLVFKILRNRGIIDSLTQFKTYLQDQELSLEEEQL